MKKFVSVLLALAMTLALSVSALAAAQDGTLTGGSITINDAVPGQTYSVYQILYLESYNAGSNAYSYKANSDWKAWLETQTEYIKIDEQGYVTWVGDQTAERAQAFAKLAQKELANKTAAATATAPAAAEGATYSTVSFNDLKLGYYLIDTTLGTLCSLDTTNPAATIEEKNAEPTNVKEVQEDANSAWGNKNDADIGQTVNFKSTITLPKGSENIVFHDTMSKGLTLNADSIKVYTDANLTSALNADSYAVSRPGEKDDCTFEISFKQNYLDGLTADSTTLYVVYSATLNEKAVVGTDGNPNTSKVSYGDSTNTKYTPDSKTTTYTWDMEILKYGDGKKENVLKDAQFVLLNEAGTKVATFDKGKFVAWVDVPAAVDNVISWPTNAVLTTGEDGKIKITGLDSDTYYLREVKAPAGYNILADDVKVTITATDGADGKTLTYKPVTAEINNQSGTELPSTGGIGTTIFYVLGGVLMAGAFVMLVVRKRMRAE